MDLLGLHIAHQPVQLGQALLVGCAGPSERHVAGHFAGVGPDEGELAYRVSAGRTGGDSRKRSGNTTQEQAA